MNLEKTRLTEQRVRVGTQVIRHEVEASFIHFRETFSQVHALKPPLDSLRPG
jgi:hypothetical protein